MYMSKNHKYEYCICTCDFCSSLKKGSGGGGGGGGERERRMQHIQYPSPRIWNKTEGGGGDVQHIQKPEDGHKLLHTYTYKRVENLENKQTLFSRKRHFDGMLHHLFVHFN